MFAKSHYPVIDEDDYRIVMSKLRRFFGDKHHMDEGFYDGNPRLLSACEDWTNIITYKQGDGLLWALPQTRQMHMEWSIMQNTNKHRRGVYACGVSYRPEAENPRLGRHHRQFPLFEWEMWGGIDVHDVLLDELLVDLGFPIPNGNPGSTTRENGLKIWQTPGSYPRVSFDNVVATYEGEPGDIGHAEEQRLEREVGTCVIKDFTKHSDPFFNMGQDLETGHYWKRDVILNGMETIGSAAREIDPLRIYKNFFKSGSTSPENQGMFHKTLYQLFGKERVNAELMDYLSLFYNDLSPEELSEHFSTSEKYAEFVETTHSTHVKSERDLQRCGGGIGLTRLISAAKNSKYNLMRYW